MSVYLMFSTEGPFSISSALGASWAYFSLVLGRPLLFYVSYSYAFFFGKLLAFGIRRRAMNSDVKLDLHDHPWLVLC